MFYIITGANTELRDTSRTAISNKLLMNRTIRGEPSETGHDRLRHIC
jgi:hypothetical protein